MSRCSASPSTACSAARIDRAAPALFAEVLERFGALTFRAAGHSMLPSISSGQLVAVTDVTIDDVRPGDVILYQRDGRLVAHRLVRIARDAGDWLLVARGDAHWACDSPITSAQLVGRLAGIPPCTPAGRIRGIAKRIGFTVADRLESRVRRLRLQLAVNPGATR